MSLRHLWHPTLTIGPASETDADSRTQLASVRFTGSGTYTLSFSSTALKAGQTVLPHLYRSICSRLC